MTLVSLVAYFEPISSLNGVVRNHARKSINKEFGLKTYDPAGSWAFRLWDEALRKKFECPGDFLGAGAKSDGDENPVNLGCGSAGRR
jgi:hypothetical protein